MVHRYDHVIPTAARFGEHGIRRHRTIRVDSLGLRRFINELGRPVRDDKRVTFSFDLGAAYQGEPSLWARSVRSDGTREYIDVTKNDIIDLSEAISEYGQYMNFWPTLNFHLYFRLF